MLETKRINKRVGQRLGERAEKGECGLYYRYHSGQTIKMLRKLTYDGRLESYLVFGDCNKSRYCLRVPFYRMHFLDESWLF